MTRNWLIPIVAVVDGDIKLSRLIARELRTRLGKDVTIAEFRDGERAWEELVSSENLDPHVIVTDTVGVFPPENGMASKVRERFPRTRILLHATDEDPAAVVRWQNVLKLIDRYIAKSDNSVQHVCDETEESYRSYEEGDLVLKDMREYIQRHPNPRASYTLIDNQDFSVLDLYWQIARATQFGAKARRVWHELQSMAIAGDGQGRAR